jgi:hypothetical protein
MNTKLNRRQLIQAGIATAAFTHLPDTEGSASAQENARKQAATKRAYCEPQRKVPVVEAADVVVCGAGPAGVAAALAAARTGANTTLIEAGGCLGGIWTAGLLCWILDTKDKPGILQEILAKLSELGAGYANRPGYSFGYDVEAIKLLLEQMCLQAGVRIQLHTRVVAAASDNNRLTYAITESKSGRQAWPARIFVDATGDGDLAARAGCSFELGRPSDGITQPMSMMAILTGVRHHEIEQFVRGKEKNSSIPKKRLLAEMQRAGVTPSYSRPTLFRIYDNLFCLAANHEYGYSPTDAAQITEATLHARAELHRIVNALRRLGGVWKNMRIVATNEHIGVREGRRIHGLYTVSKEDLINGARHEDAVCRVYFPVDVHSPKKTEGTAIARSGVRSKPYDIPFRSLVARDINALLLAGRCISGDFIAHSSYRVTGNAVALGQAAGTAAALAARNGCLPQALPWREIQAAMQEMCRHTRGSKGA